MERKGTAGQSACDALEPAESPWKMTYESHSQAIPGEDGQLPAPLALYIDAARLARPATLGKLD